MTAPGRILFRALSACAAAVIVVSGVGGARADSKWGLVFLGDRMWSGDVRAVSLGSDLQIIDDSLAVQINPATFANARKFTFNANVYFTSDKGKSDEWAETDASFKFSSLVFAVPIVPRLSIGLGYRGRYDATSAFVVERETDDGQKYGDFYNRTGGLTSFPFVAGVHIAKFLQLGGYFSVEKGRYVNRWDIVFADPTMAPSNSTQTWDMRGTGYGFGVVLRPPGDVLLGVTYDGEVEYDTDVTEEFTNPINNRKWEQTSKLPARWTVSAAWKFHRLFSAYGTYSYCDFTQFVGLAFPQDRLYTEQLISGGFEYLRGLRIADRRFPIRVGANYTELPYDFPKGERVKSFMIELGMGLKFRSGKGKIDFAIQGGTTGDIETNGMENRTIRIFVGISGAEVWRRHGQTKF
jgi:long-subunit fatty acid transport protein